MENILFLMMQLLSWQMFWKSKRPYSMMISPVSFLYPIPKR